MTREKILQRYVPLKWFVDRFGLDIGVLKFMKHVMTLDRDLKLLKEEEQWHRSSDGRAPG